MITRSSYGCGDGGALSIIGQRLCSPSVRISSHSSSLPCANDDEWLCSVRISSGFLSSACHDWLNQRSSTSMTVSPTRSSPMPSQSHTVMVSLAVPGMLHGIVIASKKSGFSVLLRYRLRVDRLNFLPNVTTRYGSHEPSSSLGVSR